MQCSLHHPLSDETADHRNPSQWRFYVIAAWRLPDRPAISLRRGEALAAAVGLEDLAEAVSLELSGPIQTLDVPNP